MRLQGKTALITGGGSGIGAACACALANEGCRVAICGRQADTLAETAARHTGVPPMLTRVCDVADRKAARELVAWAEKELGRIDILLNAAGVNVPNRTFKDLSPEDWDRLLAINTTGAFHTIFFASPAMRARKDGLIVNIGSTAGKRANSLGGIAYNASKFALAGLSTSASDEFREDGVRVTTIHPGEVETPILRFRAKSPTPEHRAKMMQPEDVAAAVLLVCTLPARANVLEMVIKPTAQAFV